MATKRPPESTRRPNRGLITVLPAEGPGVPAPKWPLDGPRPGEAAVWKRLWDLPQAFAWHHLQYERVVARYTRLLVRAENAGGDGSGVVFQGEVRRLEESLGLTPKSMHILNWRIVDSSDADAEGAPSVTALEAYRKAVGDA